MKSLRLLVTDRCNRSCEGCCNKDWDLDALPVVDDYSEYDEILLTGGEPLLDMPFIMNVCDTLRVCESLILYTAMVDKPLRILSILPLVDGITLTLHEPRDAKFFKRLNDMLSYYPVEHQSLRLNVFSGVDISGIDTYLWEVKDGIEWVKDCPLPKNEDFRRL